MGEVTYVCFVYILIGEKGTDKAYVKETFYTVGMLRYLCIFSFHFKNTYKLYRRQMIMIFENDHQSSEQKYGWEATNILYFHHYQPHHRTSHNLRFHANGILMTSTARKSVNTYVFVYVLVFWSCIL